MGCAVLPCPAVRLSLPWLPQRRHRKLKRRLQSQERSQLGGEACCNAARVTTKLPPAEGERRKITLRRTGRSLVPRRFRTALPRRRVLGKAKETLIPLRSRGPNLAWQEGST